MKSEERHELKENDLELQLQRILLWLQKNWHLPLLVVALCLLAYQGYNWWQTKKELALQESWGELTLAAESETETVAKLNSVIKKYDNPDVRAYAYLQVGDLYSTYVLLGAPDEGYRGLKATRQEALTEGRDAYNKVLRDYKDQALAITLAKLGIARIDEAEGQWDKAAELYKDIAGNAQQAPGYAAEAKRRLDHLGEWRQAAALMPLAVATSPAPAAGTQAK